MNNDDENFKGNKTEGGTTELEARVVAWVLGEASAFEAAELERWCAELPELAVFKRRMEAVHGLLGEATRPAGAAGATAGAGLRLAPERRAKVLAVIGGGAEATDAAARVKVAVLEARRGEDKGWRAWAMPLVACLVVAGLLAAWAVSSVETVFSSAELPKRPDPGATVIGMEGSLDERVFALEAGVPANAAPSALMPMSPPPAPGNRSYAVKPAGESNGTRSFTISGGRPMSPPPSPAPVMTAPSAAPKSNLDAAKPKEGELNSVSFTLDNTVKSEYVFRGVTDAETGALVSSGTATGSFSGTTLGGGSLGASGNRDLRYPSSFGAPLDEARRDADRPVLGLGAGLGNERLEAVAAQVQRRRQTARSDRAAADPFAPAANESAFKDQDVRAAGVKVDAGVDYFAPPAERESGAVSRGNGLAQVEAKMHESMLEDVSKSWQRPGELIEADKKKQAESGEALGDGYASLSASSVVDRWGDAVIPQVNFSGVDLARALSALTAVSEDTGAGPTNIVLEGVEGVPVPMVNMTLRNLSLRRTLDLMTESVGYVYTVEGDTVVVRPSGSRNATHVPPVDSLRAETVTAEEAVSTFSLHVSDASFRLAKAALERGERPEAGTVRPEEFYNAFDYGDPAPGAGEAVACRVEQAAHPFLQQRNLVRIALRVPAAGRGAGQALHLTVLLDTSGSMEREDRAAAVRAALAALAGLLGPEDRVSLVGFARTPRLLAEAVPGDQAARLVEIAARTPAEGGTNLEAALMLAGEIAARQRRDGAQNRIVLLTDGAANLGDADPARLMRRVETLRQQGIAFDACGVGADGLDDTVLEALTRKGDGRYTLINTPEEADAGFARQLAGAFRPAAKDVKVQVRFNPARVTRYRLIGFEKHRLRTEDFRNDAVDAAELAAEEAAVALYQVEVKADGEGELGEVAVRFREMASGHMVERRWPLDFAAQAPAFDRAAASMRLAGSAAFVAEKLRGGALAGQVRLEEFSPVVEGLAAAYGNDARVADFITMFRQARRVTGE